MTRVGPDPETKSGADSGDDDGDDGAAVDEDAAVVAEFPKLNDELMPPALLDAGC